VRDLGVDLGNAAVDFAQAPGIARRFFLLQPNKLARRQRLVGAPGLAGDRRHPFAECLAEQLDRSVGEPVRIDGAGGADQLAGHNPGSRTPFEHHPAGRLGVPAQVEHRGAQQKAVGHQPDLDECGYCHRRASGRVQTIRAAPKRPLPHQRAHGSGGRRQRATRMDCFMREYILSKGPFARS